MHRSRIGNRNLESLDRRAPADIPRCATGLRESEDAAVDPGSLEKRAAWEAELTALIFRAASMKVFACQARIMHHSRVSLSTHAFP
jgi:hypothetical protein